MHKFIVKWKSEDIIQTREVVAMRVPGIGEFVQTFDSDENVVFLRVSWLLIRAYELPVVFCYRASAESVAVIQEALRSVQ